MQNVEHIARHRAQMTPAPRTSLRAVGDSRGQVMPHSAVPLVELKRVSKVFSSRRRGTVTAVNKLDLKIDAASGEVVTGPSGSGKTTLLSLVGCLTRPTAGRISFNGEELSCLSEDRLSTFRRRRFGFVFQQNLLIPGMSALDNVMVPALPRPEVNGSLVAKAGELLERLAAGSYAAERVELLSGGQQQRVAIARALINDPQLLICDEPTAHLGAHRTEDFLHVLETLCASGMAVLVASHDAGLVHSGLFARRLELHGGQLRPECA